MVHDLLFQNPDLYDFVFRYDVGAEIAMLSRHAEIIHSSSILVPACGTGRYAAEIATVTKYVTAFDLEKCMIEYARTFRKLPNLDYYVGNMTWFSNNLPESAFDSAFLLNNSFRYLLSRDQALSHLKSMHQSLKNGAHYVIELGINETEDMLGNKINWSAQAEEYIVDVEWTFKNIEDDLMTEDINIRISSGSEIEVLNLVQKQLRWTTSQLVQIAAEAGFRVQSWVNRDGWKLRPQDLLTARRVHLVLKKEGSNAT